ncbi:glycosyl hydrolase family 95 catalytic domain-containing protein [Streptomyces tubercidicus]
MNLVRFRDDQGLPRVGVTDSTVVYDLRVPDMAALLRLRVTEIQQLIGAAMEGDPVTTLGAAMLLAPIDGRTEDRGRPRGRDVAGPVRRGPADPLRRPGTAGRGDRSPCRPGHRLRFRRTRVRPALHHHVPPRAGGAREDRRRGVRCRARNRRIPPFPFGGQPRAKASTPMNHPEAGPARRDLPSIPAAGDNLRLAAPISRWDDAVPLGNGLMGGLLWGGDNSLRLSLDRGDLWDERTTGESEWWRKHPWNSLEADEDPWAQYYEGVTPTKLPAGHLEVGLDPAQRIQSFELNLATAEGVATLGDGTAARIFFSATEPVALISVPGATMPTMRLVPAGADDGPGDVGPSSGGAVAALGYAAAEHGQTEGAQWYVQEAANGFAYCACVATRRTGEGILMALTITSTKDCGPGEDLLALAMTRCETALTNGYAGMLAPHAAWWQEFWSQSSVSVPEPHIQRYYQFARYLYGAGSRQGAPPMPLQGVWTADDGGLPPWKGDYHNDLNTQMTYIAYQQAGNVESGASYLDFLWELRPAFRQFATDFYGTGGLASPGVMSISGQPLGGWGQYAMSPTMSAWNAHLFYTYWRYTGDEAFLKDRAYPWCGEVGQCMADLLEPDAQGVLALPRSSSPEIFDNGPRAWLKPNSNYDLMCLKMLFLSLAEMADTLNDPADARKWSQFAANLGDFHTAADGELLLDAVTPLRQSHRHLSHLIGIYPFNLISIDGGQVDRERIRSSLAAWDSLGTGEWCGYTWAWMSCLRARVGDAEAALRHLDVFTRAFVTRSGFHVNGDQSGEGFSDLTYRPFTLEGNFAAMQAVQEMLLQSWSPTAGQRDTEVLRLFPATPWRWHEAEFTDLRAEGGHLVSAKRENNATIWFKIVAGKDGPVRIRDNFGGREPSWAGQSPVDRVGENFEVRLREGEILEAAFRPAPMPAEPADAAVAVVIGTTADTSTP